MAKELIINASLPEVRIALLEDGTIQELFIERSSDKGIVGNIYKGRVTRVLPGMQAAFVDVGLDKAAFLYVDDIYVHPKVMGDDAELEDEAMDSDAPEVAQPRLILPNRTQNNELSGDAAPAVSVSPSGDISPEGSSAQSMEMRENADMEAMESEAHDLDESYDDQEEDSDEEDSDDEDSEETDSENVDSEQDDSDDEEESEEESEAMAASDGSGNEELDTGSGDSNNQNTESLNDAETPRPEGVFLSSSVPAADATLGGLADGARGQGRRRFRGRRNRKRGAKDVNTLQVRVPGGEAQDDLSHVPDAVHQNLQDQGQVHSDRASIGNPDQPAPTTGQRTFKSRGEFKEPRARDRRIKSKQMRPRAAANISDLLKEGQEVIVQVAKDPIATKGARLTCHVSLPGRHLVCMPTIDHVGVSRRIERDDERRKLRDFVEKNRTKKMGFIVRTASGGKDPESWIKQDIDYLSKTWKDIRTKADQVSAPACVYEDLNSILRAIRDWVNEEIDRIVVDSRYHYNELLEFADRFMPSLKEKVELYQGDIPIFDAYGLSPELNRSLERKVWLKSGGSIVIDQAEALVAIDVNTGRFVGKKNLEDTILKTNLEAAEEIAYQLRLRNCGGIIIVDFIDMEREDNRMRVYRALDEALKRDRARPTIQKISELGLVEMTRKRTRDTLVRSLCEPCTHCEGKGFTKSHQTVAYEILREVERLCVDREAKKILISAHESVIDLLAIELRDAVDQLERRHNKQVYLQAIVDYHPEQFEVVTDRAQNKKSTQDIARQLRIERDRSDRKEKQKQRRDEDDSKDMETGQDAKPTIKIELRLDDGSAPVETSQAVVPANPIVLTTGQKGAFVTSPKKDQNRDQPRSKDRNQRPQFDDQSIASDVSRNNNSNSMPRQTGAHMDEDQLAYLRAQAAQDAALATNGVVSPSVPDRNQNRGGRGAHQRPGRGQQQPRHQKGGRHAGPPRTEFNLQLADGNGGSGSTGSRFRGGDESPVAQAVDQAVPDYEVLVNKDSSDGEGTN